ncbi:MAG: hypothetical protein C4542_02970 [Dehalococcoidia bacterium]|nr:MAG: hypothetical protein C4542_02970 [Dehalococcoidia bacterium]
MTDWKVIAQLKDENARRNDQCEKLGQRIIGLTAERDEYKSTVKRAQIALDLLYEALNKVSPKSGGRWWNGDKVGWSEYGLVSQAIAVINLWLGTRPLLARCLDALRRLEWRREGDMPPDFCPVCTCIKKYGHWTVVGEERSLAALIRDLEAVRNKGEGE